MYRYDDLSILAEGGQGRVYRAIDRVSGNRCVLKTGHSVLSEAFLALQLNHPYIANPFDAGIYDNIGQAVAYPEYGDPSLLDWRKTAHVGELQRVALQIAEFLAFVHQRGWLYHDFKPEHFLVSNQAIRVLDLGLAEPIDKTSQTFSGTFPYIAPERLAGRKCDARSDIFAMGMLLLHALLPDERWDFEPSLEVLQNLQKRTRKITGFWKDLLSEMISLEPAQRIESATELWKRLLPSSGRGIFLFFPMPAYFTIPENFLQKQIVTVQSASNLNISEVEKITLQESWKKGIFTASFDLRNKTPEEVFRTLCWAQLNQQPSDLFAAIECLQKASSVEPFTVVLRHAESLNPSQRSLLAYALSALQNSPSLHFVFLGNKQVVEVPDESSAKIEIPLLTKQTLNDILPQAFPIDGVKQERLEKFRSRGYSLPDQMLADLRKQLPPEAFLLWPAAAKDLAPAAALERLRPTEMRILGSLAIATSPMPKDWLFQSLHLAEAQGMEWIESLQARGYLQLQNVLVTIVINPQAVLERLRKDRFRQIATTVLSNAPLTADPEILYRFAKASHKKSNARFQALRVASRFPERSDAAQEWYWKAFLAGAQLPKSNLYQLVKFSMRTAHHKRTRIILNSIRKRFGRSVKLAHLWLDFYLRTADFKSGEKLAEKLASIMKNRNRTLESGFFQARKAGFMIRQNNYDEAENILDDLRNSSSLTSNKNLSAFIDHYFGLAYFHKGKFDLAIHSFERATKGKLYELSNSLMNMGIVFSRLGELEKAEKLLTKAVRFFQKQNDSERLSYALGNLGVLLKQRGKLQEARTCYFKSLHLSRIYKNTLGVSAALSNLSTSYELEGRLTKALHLANRTTQIARRAQLPRQIAYGLTHAGRIYAIMGEHRLSVEYLKQAIEIRDKLGHSSELAISHETLGLTYMFSGHSRQALIHFSNAFRLFEKSSAILDCKRVELFAALTTHDLSALKNLEAGAKDSFESGLHHYLIAQLLLKSNSDSDSEITSHLSEAERVFRNVPSLFWLGRTLKLKAEYCLQKYHFEKAGIHLESAYNIFSRLGARRELLSLKAVTVNMRNSSDLLNSIAERLPYKVLLMVKDVLTERNPEKMINRILSTSLEFTDMERAVLILSEDPPRIFKSTTFDDNSVQEIFEISRSAMEEAAESRQPYIRLNAIEDSYLKGKPSIIANRIGSVLCLPLRSAEKTIGVLYLDSREGISSVAKTESVLLEIFSNIMSLVLEDAVALEKSRNENEILKQKIQNNQPGEILGSGKVIEDLKKTVYRLSRIDHHILITGETGVGKELVARMLHESSKRKDAPFIAINCASLPEMLLESELFGHEKGAFTDANQLKKGLFEEAQNGTLFLDEIGELPYSVQAKLLRVLQEREFRRVGGNSLLKSNARIIFATNKDLAQQVQKNQFREDLYYRVSGVQIHIPPLRERKEDIALLAKQFLKTTDVSNKFRGFSRDALHLMEQYSWPGNIRQLKYEVERIAALCENAWIQPEDFSKLIHVSSKEALKTETLKSIEKEVIQERLKRFAWNIVRTANSLGLTRHGLYSKMKLFGINRKDSQKDLNKKV